MGERGKLTREQRRRFTGGSDWLRFDDDRSQCCPIETIADIENTDPVTHASDETLTLSDYIDPETFNARLSGERGNTATIIPSIDEYIVELTTFELIVERTADHS